MEEENATKLSKILGQIIKISNGDLALTLGYLDILKDTALRLMLKKDNEKDKEKTQ